MAYSFPTMAYTTKPTSFQKWVIIQNAAALSSWCGFFNSLKININESWFTIHCVPKKVPL